MQSRFSGQFSNGDNKQKEVRGPSNELIGEYLYDGEGRRVKKHRYVGGVLTEVTVFVYSAGKLAAEYSTAPPEQNPTTKWTVTDQLGSPRVLVDSLGQVVSRRDFMPFGEEITPDGTHRKADLKYNFGDNIRQKFTGYQKDEETQLDFAEARMYQNLHGRFTAVDPLLASGKSANPQTFNRYVYVINNPIILVDPDGLQVASSVGRVYQRDEYEFQIFGDDDVIPDGFKPFDGNVTYTANDGFVYNVFANGFDNLGLSLTGSIQRSAASRLTEDQGLTILKDFAQRANNATDGISTGTSNFLRGSFNLVTQPGGIFGTLGGIPNPLALERVPYQNPQAAAYGFFTEFAWGAWTTAGTGGGAASGLSRASSLSVVPNNVPRIPTLVFDYNKHPQLAENIFHAQKAGHPSILTWQGSSNASRTDALRGIPRILSRDEYPFASTAQGGRGAWVGHIPGSQNSAQGRLILDFKNANKLQPGDKFRVCVINYPGC